MENFFSDLGEYINSIIDSINAIWASFMEILGFLETEEETTDKLIG